MGKDSQGTEANSSGSENYGLDSCEAHHVSGGAQEDRCGTKGEMGEVEGGEEEIGGLSSLGEPVRIPDAIRQANDSRRRPNRDCKA